LILKINVYTKRTAEIQAFQRCMACLYHNIPSYLISTFFKERASTFVVFRGAPHAAQFQIRLLKPKFWEKNHYNFFKNFIVMPNYMFKMTGIWKKMRKKKLILASWYTTVLCAVVMLTTCKERSPLKEAPIKTHIWNRFSPFLTNILVDYCLKNQTYILIFKKSIFFLVFKKKSF
jgi:hypothetical protein